MSQSNSALNAFLKTARAQLGTGKTKCVIMGNEAADLDSMASAVTYAWYKQMSGIDAAFSYVPLIPIPREDFRLRTEAAYLFGEAGIHEDELLFIEDIDLAALSSTGKLKLILVDHNKLGKAFSPYADSVIEVIDHHQNEGLYPATAKKIIEPVGSASTLVAECIVRDIKGSVDTGIATLLAGTILLDTVNLDPAAGRVTEKDAKIASILLTRSGREQKSLFDALQYEKFNVANLSTTDILRKDYKEYTMGEIRYGMSSALLSLEVWKKKDPRLAGELASYAASRKLNILIVMNAYTEPKFTRELVLYGSDDSLLGRLAHGLEGADLGLTALTAPAGADPQKYRWYSQANESYSRKKLQPVIQTLLS